MIRASLLLLISVSACSWSTGGQPIGDGGVIPGGGGNQSGGGNPVPDGTPGLPHIQADGPWTLATANLAGMPTECGSPSLMSVRPDKDWVIVSVAGHGLFASIDGAAEWTALGQGPGSAKITNRAASIVYDPVRPDTFWESGIYNGPGAYRTTDGGMTFTVLGDASHADVMSVDLTDPERKTMIYAGHEKLSWVRRSRDGGSTWEAIGMGIPGSAGFPAVPLVLDANTYLMGTYQAPQGGHGIFRTADGGQTWTQVHAGTGVADRPLIASDGSIYWGLSQGLVRSTDKGLTWRMVTSTQLARGWPSMDLLPDGRLLGIGGSALLVSADQGATWRPIAPALPFQPNGAIYAPRRKAIYIWRWDCVDGPIPADEIQKLAFDHTKN